MLLTSPNKRIIIKIIPCLENRAMVRTILHVDFNNFYASVECLEHPELRGLPVAVGGDVEQRHGIVLAKNYIAKAYGVKTAEVIWQAKQKCPGLVVVPPHFDRYMEYSRRARDILARYADRVEPFGADEAWLDISPYAKTEKDGREIADEIRACYKNELGLTCSVGVSFNKVFAKLGSDMKKPDATTVIPEDDFKSAVWGLPVEELLFVGPATKAKLNLRGIMTIGQLAGADPSLVHAWLGANGDKLRAAANGLDSSPVMFRGQTTPIKSIGNSTTLPRDVTNESDAVGVLQAMAESVAERLRSHRLLASTVVLFVRDSGLYSFERQCRLNAPTNLAMTLRCRAFELLRANWNWQRSIRSLGVRAASLTPEKDYVQLSFFNDDEAASRRLSAERTVDAIRGKYGKNTILLGAAAYAGELGRMAEGPVTSFNLDRI